MRDSHAVESFIQRWSNREGGQERANYSLFLTELCDVLEVPHPDPADASHEFNDYVFERRVERRLADGTAETRRIDLYRRGSFILEAKQSRRRVARRDAAASQGDLFSEPAQEAVPYSASLDHLMIQARRQAEGYATALPPDHPYPPFLIICDVGRAFELYADFSGHGRHYAQFPDTQRFRIELAQLRDPARWQLLRTVWEAPWSLDPAQQSAKVTREIAGRLATISKSLEGRGFEPGCVAVFLMRCLFTMFVEDVGLLRRKGFTEILDRCLADPARFTFEIDDLWRHMDEGTYSPGVGQKLLRFNGKLFKNATALPLTLAEIALLRHASDADWGDLEPAIFGTLFEQALDPVERKRLGAHYTPRAYVERLVDATIIEPLFEDWRLRQAAADQALRRGMTAEATREIEDFLNDLAKVRVLDPACGTGNFLYVALSRMKQLEGEALKQLNDIGGRAAVERVRDISVRPEQFFGMELNRRAVEIAELVLWIGYIQWHLRARAAIPPEPVLGSSDHVHEKDALLTWDGYPHRPPKRDLVGRPAGAGGRLLPNARRPEWPAADFIVGNPPFIGGKDIRGRLGGDYAEALWKAHPQINPSADLVMYWWDRAAELLTRKDTRLRRFGFVTTNSVTQVFQRRVLERHLQATPPVSLLMAIPDHPWTKATRDAAAVRIAMTVAGRGKRDGVLQIVTAEQGLDTDEPRIEFKERSGRINPDLTIGVDLTRTTPLLANAALCSPGVKLHGDGFIVSREQAAALGLGRRPGLERYIKPYRNGRDLTARSRDVMVVDLFGLPAERVRRDFPEVYQHLLRTVKASRKEVFAKKPTKDSREYLDRWWQFGKPRTELRQALRGLDRYIATVETTKHRVFQFLDASVLPDNMLVAVASDDAFLLGVLSSRPHGMWTATAGGTLEDRPRYTKSRCFDPFPFPDPTAAVRLRIGRLAEELDATRKLVLAENPDLTLTMLYNALDARRAGTALSPKQRDVEARGRVLILEELHERLDALVLQAYGWPEDIAEEEVLERLVALNQGRAAEERLGFVKWLRPDYQIERLGPLAHRADRVQSITVAAKPKARPAFPDALWEQTRSVFDLLGRRLTPDQLAALYRDGARIRPQIDDVLKSLSELGLIESPDGGRSYIRAAS